MKCQRCGGKFTESEIDESHDVPCYLFGYRNRRENKLEADKFGRHHLCKECHNQYEKKLRVNLISCADKFASKYFGDTNGL